jgi:hypothetical protein
MGNADIFGPSDELVDFILRAGYRELLARWKEESLASDRMDDDGAPPAQN